MRWTGLGTLIVLGIATTFPSVQALMERPFKRIGQRQVGTGCNGFVLGIALGTVYEPCAGPVLAAITVTGATHRIGIQTIALTVAFALGAAAPCCSSRSPAGKSRNGSGPSASGSAACDSPPASMSSPWPSVSPSTSPTPCSVPVPDYTARLQRRHSLLAPSALKNGPARTDRVLAGGARCSRSIRITLTSALSPW
ncbi:cytochrome c biogenesis CcdA family protein [Streptomyces sp. NPDC058440]|uniref:cytochrome c biogenesis CcdA family protein n=1 Tax=Streptomyces sp. NPDC058440 TaxID=3346501 RepID=UPI00365BE5DE